MSKATVTIFIEGTPSECKEHVRSIAHDMGIDTGKPIGLAYVSSFFRALGMSPNPSPPGLNKVHAVKAVREHFGCSLKDAKDVVEGVY